MTDIKCHVRNPMLGHFLCNKISQEFVADAGNTWDPHPLNMDQQSLGIVNNNYTVVVEGPSAPVVCIHRQTVVIQFNMHKVY